MGLDEERGLEQKGKLEQEGKLEGGQSEADDRLLIPRDRALRAQSIHSPMTSLAPSTASGP
jgi:hypothetical protein